MRKALIDVRVGDKWYFELWICRYLLLQCDFCFVKKWKISLRCYEHLVTGGFFGFNLMHILHEIQLVL